MFKFCSEEDLVEDDVGNLREEGRSVDRSVVQGMQPQYSEEVKKNICSSFKRFLHVFWNSFVKPIYTSLFFNLRFVNAIKKCFKNQVVHVI